MVKVKMRVDDNLSENNDQPESYYKWSQVIKVQTDSIRCVTLGDIDDK